MVVTIRPKTLAGAVTPPPSKSMAHRLILCAAMARGISVLHNVALSQDILATLRCAEALGAQWEQEASTLTITGIDRRPWSGELPHFDCGESGSTLRFFIPIALAVAGGGVFTGRGRLMERPLKPYFDLFDEKNIAYEQKDGVLTVKGGLSTGTYPIAGNVSSQFLTGLLLALQLMEGESKLLLTTQLESRDYVTMTLEAMARFGAEVRQEGASFQISGGKGYHSREETVEADWSQGAFWYAANFLDNPVEVRGLDPGSVQGDRVVASYYWTLARPGDVELDLSQCPDLLPPLALMAALRNGTCRMVNAARLRIKESDRLASVAATLNALGVRVEEGPDSLTIHGGETLAGNVTLDCCNDHRIAMMAAIAATKCSGPINLTGADCVNKSYPDFWDHYRMLGGDMDVLVSGQ